MFRDLLPARKDTEDKAKEIGRSDFALLASFSSYGPANGCIGCRHKLVSALPPKFSEWKDIPFFHRESCKAIRRGRQSSQKSPRRSGIGPAQPARPKRHLRLRAVPRPSKDGRASCKRGRRQAWTIPKKREANGGRVKAHSCN